MSVQEMEGFDELMRKFLDSLPPEQRLAGLSPEEVLAHYAPVLTIARTRGNSVKFTGEEPAAGGEVHR